MTERGARADLLSKLRANGKIAVTVMRKRTSSQLDVGDKVLSRAATLRLKPNQVEEVLLPFHLGVKSDRIINVSDMFTRILLQRRTGYNIEFPDHELQFQPRLDVKTTLAGVHRFIVEPLIRTVQRHISWNMKRQVSAWDNNAVHGIFTVLHGSNSNSSAAKSVTKSASVPRPGVKASASYTPIPAAVSTARKPSVGPSVAQATGRSVLNSGEGTTWISSSVLIYDPERGAVMGCSGQNRVEVSNAPTYTHPVPVHYPLVNKDQVYLHMAVTMLAHIGYCVLGDDFK